MRLLIDSNVFLWSAFQPARLSRRAIEAMADGANQLVVSVVTPIELGIAVSKGKFDPGVPLHRFYLEHLAALEADEMPIIRAHALAATTLPYVHRDPMDRILAAQSIVEGLPLVTNDGKIASLGADVIW